MPSHRTHARVPELYSLAKRLGKKTGRERERERERERQGDVMFRVGGISSNQQLPFVPTTGLRTSHGTAKPLLSATIERGGRRRRGSSLTGPCPGASKQASRGTQASQKSSKPNGFPVVSPNNSCTLMSSYLPSKVWLIQPGGTVN